MIALAFNGLIWHWRGSDRGPEFLTGYIVEWTLSMDNVFVFAVIFSFFRVELKYQYRVLFWGILGAIVMRLTFVLVGTALISRFDWVMPLFGLFLIYSGIKLCLQKESDFDPEKNLLRRLATKVFAVASGDLARSSLSARTAGWPLLRCFWCCWWSRAPTSSLPSTACRRSS